MKKLYLFLLFVPLTLLWGCKSYDGDIDDLNSKIDALTNTSIPTIQQQVTAINSSINALKNTDEQLQEYITTLQGQATTLTNSLSETNKQIDKVKTELSSNITTAKADVIAQLESYKTTVNGQLTTINNTITALQAKDKTLQDNIDALKTYVNSEIKATKDWATATFATIEQYNTVAGDVATIKGQIEALNTSMTNLDAIVKQKVDEDEFKKVISELKSSTQTEIDAITTNCNDAIAKAKTDITAAYTTAIQNAITASENSMKSWVNERLTNYYTITETEAKLAALKSDLEGQLSSQKSYLEGLITNLETAVNKKISDNTTLITALRKDLTTTQGTMKTNAANIATNSDNIAANASKILQNANDIAANSGKIENNAKLIEANKKLIDDNTALINSNKTNLATLSGTVQTNASHIADNAQAIANNAALISKNATAITNNTQAISDNAADIVKLNADLLQAKKDLTDAYSSAITTAINTLDGKISKDVATQIETVNAKIDNEVKTINDAMTALTKRVGTLEGEVTAIKTAIYNIQTDIEDIKAQIAKILKQIQSVSYVPQYADGRATMYYTNSAGTITAGSATMDFELKPASTADELVKVWNDALNMKAVYTKTRTAEFVDLTIESATATNGILSLVVSGANLSEAFFKGEISANARLQISDGNSELTSNYINMVPTIGTLTIENISIPDTNFKNYLVANYDANGDHEISTTEAESIENIDIASSTIPIESLVGIGYCKNLKTLNCSNNSLTGLDLSNNTKLTSVIANNNQLTSLNLKGCTELVTLNCRSNKITTLDISSNLKLERLNCNNNSLTNLNIDNNSNLAYANFNGQNVGFDFEVGTYVCYNSHKGIAFLKTYSDYKYPNAGSRMIALDETTGTHATYMAMANNPTGSNYTSPTVYPLIPVTELYPVKDKVNKSLQFLGKTTISGIYWYNGWDSNYNWDMEKGIFNSNPVSPINKIRLSYYFPN